MAERVDQVGDVVAKEADEDGVLVFRIDRLAFGDRITDRQVCLAPARPPQRVAIATRLIVTLRPLEVTSMRWACVIPW